MIPESKTLRRMAPEENTSIRQMFTDVIATHTAEINGKFELIKQELGQIKEQTTKHNGRMEKIEDKIKLLEKEDLTHLLKCPMKGRVAKLEDTDKSKRSVWQFVKIIAAIVATLSTIVIAFFELYKK